MNNSFQSSELSRRSLLKFAGVGAVALSSSSLLAACAGRDAGVPDKANPLLMDHLVANVPAFDSTHAAFAASAKALEAKSEFTSHDGDIQKGLSQVQQFGSLGVLGVHSAIFADGSIDRYSQILADQKVANTNLANRLPWLAPTDPKFNGYYLGTVGGPFADEAYIVSKILFERGGNKGEVILLGGPKGGYSETGRRFGVMKAISETPGVTVVANSYTDWDQSKAQAALETLLPAHPDVKFVLAFNDGVALGALAALKAARNTTALLCGMDGDPGFLEVMENEERIVCTSGGMIAFSGVLAAVRLYDFINGIELNPLESFMNTDSVIIDTPEAASALLELTSEDKPVLWDATKMSRHLNGDDWITQHRCLVADPATDEWAEGASNPTPRPEGFAWPDSYQKAMDAGELTTLNRDWESRFEDPYGSVRAKAQFQEGVLGALKAGVSVG
ncbi:substrate-binding domain-containing protein (plasmid) [Nocardioides sp. R1-1]|uniref:substrate-binding domain-containing protein n=1 Tax=Nocardioides sp. R1-1 TaxID=3383502 RepID=UPI0038D02906